VKGIGYRGYETKTENFPTGFTPATIVRWQQDIQKLAKLFLRFSIICLYSASYTETQISTRKMLKRHQELRRRSFIYIKNKEIIPYDNISSNTLSKTTQGAV